MLLLQDAVPLFGLLDWFYMSPYAPGKLIAGSIIFHS